MLRSMRDVVLVPLPFVLRKPCPDAFKAKLFSGDLSAMAGVDILSGKHNAKSVDACHHQQVADTEFFIVAVECWQLKVLHRFFRLIEVLKMLRLSSWPPVSDLGSDADEGSHGAECAADE